MNYRAFASFVVLVFLVAVVRGTSAEPAASSAPVAKAKPPEPLDNLKQGDPASKLTELLGKPLETRPMKAPSGKAEVWIYVKEVSRRMDRIDRSTADTIINVTESDGSVRQRVTPGQVRFEDVHYVTEDVIEVLMFNEHYVLHKVTRGERKL
jgi:hypothetical protein